MVSEEQRFKSFEDVFLPLELDSIRNNYEYILQKLTRKCNNTMKYTHLADKYVDHVNYEFKELRRLEEEIGELEAVVEKHVNIAKKETEEIKKIKDDQFGTEVEPPKDIFLSM